MPQQSNDKHVETGLEIAVIGMDGKFPGAGDIDSFWENLQKGKETVTFFSDNELLEAGIPEEVVKNPRYIKARGVIEDFEYFDAACFNYTPREAMLMDPQFRLFHECCFTALETAGYTPDKFAGIIGLYAGGGFNLGWIRKVLERRGNFSELFEANTLYNTEFLTTRTAYKLNLDGPCLSVQTACSTSLVAIHLACQGLLNGECDIALAGGVSILGIDKSGYLYEEGMINSSDGHCRAFDAKADGTIQGDGIGIVALKCLDDALEEGDHIHAVLKGSAINNDGNKKVSYTAPGTQGQAAVIKAAIRLAEVEPDTIRYIEAHGTGTALGDPVEIEALTRAFATEQKRFCAIGSVKTNFGHLNSAAGVTGLIKAILVLQNRMIPPSLHYHSPNPKIDFQNSPFFVNARLSELKSGPSPLRAGVSSFGIGGTNAHVVLEEAPATKSSSASRQWQLLLLSANSRSALDNGSRNLGDYLSNQTEANLADMAFTLQVGRKDFPHRRMLVCEHTKGARELLTSPDTNHNVHTNTIDKGREKPRTIFMFPGQGSQYVKMGQDLYRSEPAFQEILDYCFRIIESLTGEKPAEIVFSDDPNAINQTQHAQPALVALEYSIARLLMEWGIIPDAMIGHSIGEYTAACISGVLSIEEAVKISTLRGRLMQHLPPGSMLSVATGPDILTPMLGEDLELAAVNTTNSCVVSGSDESIATFEEKLKEKGIDCKTLHTSHAFHSKMMAPIQTEFTKAMNGIQLQEPKIPYISNLTGKMIKADEATDPTYWWKHLRRTVLFESGLSELLKQENALFIEAGPSNVLGAFVKKHEHLKNGHIVLHAMRHPKHPVHDQYQLLEQIGKLWLHGKKIDWQSFYRHEKRHRLPLPTYPYERQRFWIDEKIKSNWEKSGIDRWFSAPTWKIKDLDHSAPTPGRWTNVMLLADNEGFGAQLVNRLDEHVGKLAVITAGESFSKTAPMSFSVNPANAADHESLFKTLQEEGFVPDAIIHLWGISTPTEHSGAITEEHILDNVTNGYHSLLNIAKFLPAPKADAETQLVCVTTDRDISPASSIMAGAIRTIPKEYPAIKTRHIEIPPVEADGRRRKKLLDQLAAELLSQSSDVSVALRRNHRWVQTFEPVKIPNPQETPYLLKRGGVYLITGGLGGIGFTLAKYLTATLDAHVILVGRTELPDKNKLEKQREIEKREGQVLILSGDVSQKSQLHRVVARAEETFGHIDGVIHAAGLADGAMIHSRTPGQRGQIFEAKIHGVINLCQLFKDKSLDIMVLCSSLASILNPIGQVAYSAANAFLDALAHCENVQSHYGIPIKTINWDTWKETGMAKKTAARLAKSAGIQDSGILLEHGMSNTEGVEVFARIMDDELSQTIVSTRDLETLLKNSRPNAPKNRKDGGSSRRKKNPFAAHKYVAPDSELGKQIALIWQNQLGIAEVGIHDNFFDLGADSLNIIQVKGKVEDLLGMEIPIVTFYTYPTIDSIMKHLNQTQDKRPTAKRPAATNKLGQRRKQIKSNG
jgi:acyl transferase domain-containing protein/acyl carrier protein